MGEKRKEKAWKLVLPDLGYLSLLLIH